MKHKISIAPMLGYTDRHFRYLIRLITRHAFLYSEMVVAQTLLYQKPDRWLAFHDSEHPIGLQLAGNAPKTLVHAAKIGEQYGYDEINLNVGCPSPRVQSGQFGCCLMAQPQLVADCVKAMQDAVSIPVTVKTRLGLLDSLPETPEILVNMYQDLVDFVELLHRSGCQTFIIHARWANLKKYSPRQNRTLPPLHYDIVAKLKQDFSDLEIILNGGIQEIKPSSSWILNTKSYDGFMIGTAAYRNPYMLSEVDALFYHDDHPIPSRQEIVKQYLEYIHTQKVSSKHALRHLPNLFRSVPNGKALLNDLLDFS